jgi:Mg-chelatase subunit ChlD
VNAPALLGRLGGRERSSAADYGSGAESGATASDQISLPGYQITDKSEVTSVLVEAGVYDKQGRFASNLDPATFVVRENGVPQETDSIAKQAVATTIVLLVDNSQSMSRRIDFVRAAAERLGDALRKQDKIIVVPFNKQLGAITGPTNDAKTIGESISAMRAQGGTAILDAIVESAKLFESRRRTPCDHPDYRWLRRAQRRGPGDDAEGHTGTAGCPLRCGDRRRGRNLTER